MTTDVERLVMREELNQYKPDADQRAQEGRCEGSCEKHTGEVRCVRVYDKASGFDWGWFAYCEEAVAEDTRRGMAFVDA